MSWQRLIRFEDEYGEEVFGEPLIDGPEELYSLLDQGELYATVLLGDSLMTLEPTPCNVKVKVLKQLLKPADVPGIKCVGLNYAKHIQESGRKPPPFPTIFLKPRTAITGHDSDILVPKIAQDTVDWEGELSIVIGKTGKDIKAEDALEYIAGYIASNDVSQRTWQRDPAYAGPVPQWCFSKGFDTFAPLGPMLVSPKVVGDGQNLLLETIVDGVVRQKAKTDDLIFGTREIIQFVSQGTTLEAGTVIMTGTPSGCATGYAEPQPYLKSGQVVEVRVEQLGSVKNKIVFES